MSKSKRTEYIMLTAEDFKRDPVLAYKLRDSYHAVIILDSHGNPRLHIPGKQDRKQQTKRNRKSVK